MKPQRLDLDYIAPPHRPLLPGLAVLAVALIAAGVLVERYRDVKLELQRIEARQGLLGSDRRPARALTGERLEEEAKSAEAVLRQLVLPWGAIIRTVEEASMPEISILQMQPDAQQRLLRIGAEARSDEAMFEYARRLAAAEAVADAHVMSHQVQMEDPQRPIQFTVQALLRRAP
jgi:hypothetical protein